MKPGYSVGSVPPGYMILDIGGAACGTVGGAVRRALAVAAVSATVAVAPRIAVTVISAAITVVSAAVAVIAARAAVSAVSAAVSARVAVPVPAISAAIVVSAIAVAAFTGIGLGHDRTVDGEMKRRDNQSQRRERSQDMPAAHARQAHPILPMPAIRPFGQTTPLAMSQH